MKGKGAAPESFLRGEIWVNVAHVTSLLTVARFQSPAVPLNSLPEFMDFFVLGLDRFSWYTKSSRAPFANPLDRK